MLETLLAFPLYFRITILSLFSACFVFWTRVVTGGLPIGIPRILASTPVFAGTFLVPYLFDPARREELILYEYIVLVYLWLVNWKVFGLAVNRGSLAKNYDSTSLPVFAALLLLPINIAHTGQREEGTSNPRDFLFRSVFKLWFTLGLAYIAPHVWHLPFLRDIALTWLLYILVTLIMDCLSYVVLVVLDVQLMSHFDQPFLATSLSNFWGHRWNLVIGTLLRDLIYFPVCQGSIILEKNYDSRENGKHVRPKPMRQAVAFLATFIASGLLHGWLIWYLSGRFGVKNMFFFVLHGLLLLLERTAKGLIYANKASKVRNFIENLPRWVCILYTLSIMHVTSHLLFWPEVVELSRDVVTSLVGK